MTETTTSASNYLTGAARFENGVLKDLVVYCIDPLTPELEAVGFMEEDYVASAEGVIGDIKAGAKFSARFDGSPQLYPLEVVTRDGKETLEVSDAYLSTKGRVSTFQMFGINHAASGFRPALVASS